MNWKCLALCATASAGWTVLITLIFVHQYLSTLTPPPLLSLVWKVKFDKKIFATKNSLLHSLLFKPHLREFFFPDDELVSSFSDKAKIAVCRREPSDGAVVGSLLLWFPIFMCIEPKLSTYRGDLTAIFLEFEDVILSFVLIFLHLKFSILLTVFSTG